MAELSDSLTQLPEDRTGRITQRIGADGARTRTAVSTAVPALLAALSQGGALDGLLGKDRKG